MEFTVLGDTVNIAARLQEAAKTTRSGLVVSQDLLMGAERFSEDDPAWNGLGESTVRGRAGKISLYEYLCSAEG